MSTETVDGGAVEAVAELARQAAGQTVEIDGRKYATTKLHDPRKSENVPSTLVFATLQSLVDYVRAKRDVGYIEEHEGVFIHVESPTSVRLCTGIFGEFHQRVELAKAAAIVPTIAFGTFVGVEQFIINLLAQFEPTLGREEVFAIVGNMKTEIGHTTKDDGVSQQVTVARGVVKVGTTDIPKAVQLRPYRTFVEVAQPDSPFSLRLRGGADRPHECALFEADGGRWRLDAIGRTKTWLHDALPGIDVYG